MNIEELNRIRAENSEQAELDYAEGLEMGRAWYFEKSNVTQRRRLLKHLQAGQRFPGAPINQTYNEIDTIFESYSILDLLEEEHCDAIDEIEFCKSFYAGASQAHSDFCKAA